MYRYDNKVCTNKVCVHYKVCACVMVIIYNWSLILLQSMRRLVSQFSGKREVHPVPNLQDFERHNNRYVHSLAVTAVDLCPFPPEG